MQRRVIIGCHRGVADAPSPGNGAFERGVAFSVGPLPGIGGMEISAGRAVGCGKVFGKASGLGQGRRQSLPVPSDAETLPATQRVCLA